MDYLGRELERQRAALAALLLGGGEGRLARQYLGHTGAYLHYAAGLLA